MVSPTRRALLATVATGVAGTVAGCQSLTDDQPSLGPPRATALSAVTLFLDDDISFPRSTTVDTVGMPADADLAVFPAHDDSVAPAIETLRADVPVAIAGEDALGTLLAVCRGDDRPYGFASNGWDSQTAVAGVVPRFPRLDTHVFATTQLPRDLPWALGELLHPVTHECAAAIDHVPIDDGAASLGTARIRGYNVVGEFDRRDRVSVVPDGEPTPVYVDTVATIVAGRAGGKRGPYRADRIETVVQFEQPFTDVGPAAGTTASLSVENRSDPIEQTARVVFSPRSDEARDGTTVCQRVRLEAEAFAEPFRYTGNVRFRWADPQLLADETFVHHTPGSAVWYPQ